MKGKASSKKQKTKKKTFYTTLCAVCITLSPFISILGFSKKLFSVSQHYKLLLLEVFLVLYKQLKVVRFCLQTLGFIRFWFVTTTYCLASLQSPVPDLFTVYSFLNSLQASVVTPQRHFRDLKLYNFETVYIHWILHHCWPSQEALLVFVYQLAGSYEEQSSKHV